HDVHVIIRARFEGKIVAGSVQGPGRVFRGHADVGVPGLSAVRRVGVEDVPVAVAAILPGGVHLAGAVDCEIDHVLLGAVRIVVDPVVRPPRTADVRGGGNVDLGFGV